MMKCFGRQKKKENLGIRWRDMAVRLSFEQRLHEGIIIGGCRRLSSQDVANDVQLRHVHIWCSLEELLNSRSVDLGA